jgi:hypothetical protein
LAVVRDVFGATYGSTHARAHGLRRLPPETRQAAHPPQVLTFDAARLYPKGLMEELGWDLGHRAATRAQIAAARVVVGKEWLPAEPCPPLSEVRAKIGF